MSNRDSSRGTAAHSIEPDVKVEISERVGAHFDSALETLGELVAIPSVAWESHDLSRVRESAERVAGLAEELSQERLELVIDVDTSTEVRSIRLQPNGARFESVAAQVAS